MRVEFCKILYQFFFVVTQDTIFSRGMVEAWATTRRCDPIFILFYFVR